MRKIEDIDLSTVVEPVIVVDRVQCEKNIAKMVALAERDGVRLRPHFKTHQSVEIGEWYRAFGVNSCAVSNMRMAEEFVSAGWEDVLLALPAQSSQKACEIYDDLAARSRLGLTGDSVELIQGLSTGLAGEIDFWIEVDGGYGRSGVRWDDFVRLERLIVAGQKAEHIRLRGFLVHAGDSYACQGAAEVKALAKVVNERLCAMMAQLEASLEVDGASLEVSYGDTPTCAVGCNVESYDEIRPGNFIFYDLMQWYIGACERGEIALTVMSPVIGVYSDRNEIVLHAGAVHLSKEVLADGSYGHLYDNEGRLLGKLSKLSQEHGVVVMEPLLAESNVAVGDVLEVTPVHSCLVVEALAEFVLKK